MKENVISVYSQPFYRNLEFVYYTLPWQSIEPKLTLLPMAFYDFLSYGGGGGGRIFIPHPRKQC